MNDKPRPDKTSPISKSAVWGGAVLGFGGSWLLFAVALLTMYDYYGSFTAVVMGAALLLIPVVSGALMLSRRTRQLGAGVLMGLAIGSVTGAGVCVGSLATWM